VATPGELLGGLVVLDVLEDRGRSREVDAGRGHLDVVVLLEDHHVAVFGVAAATRRGRGGQGARRHGDRRARGPAHWRRGGVVVGQPWLGLVGAQVDHVVDIAEIIGH
jgi:hypothetical protein